MRKMVALEAAVDKDEDPREALLKYAKVRINKLMIILACSWHIDSNDKNILMFFFVCEK